MLALGMILNMAKVKEYIHAIEAIDKPWITTYKGKHTEAKQAGRVWNGKTNK